MDVLEHAVAIAIALCAVLLFAAMIWAGPHQS
jgi:hypothetical protein